MTNTRSLTLALALLAPACGLAGDPGSQYDGIDCAADPTAPGCCDPASDAGCPPPPPPVAVCGNATLEEGESCDDGNLDGGDGCDATCQVEASAYRITSMKLLDPHAYTFGLDVTNTLNTKIGESLVQDKDADGFVDLSIVQILRPWVATAAARAAGDMILSNCGMADTTQCGPRPDGIAQELVLENGAEAASCLAAETGTNRFAVGEVVAPCFASAAQTIDLNLAGVAVHLEHARIGASYGSVATDGLGGGLFSGFMTKAAADATILPANLPVVGGKPLSAVLKASDMDTGPAGEAGWWFYIQFAASPAIYTR